jgi:putative MFS transporter
MAIQNSESKQTIRTITARLDRLPTDKWHIKILWILGLGVLCDTLDMYMGGAILAALVASDWSNNTLNGWFISATMLGAFIGSLTTGYIGDKFGRKKCLLINLLIFGLASIAAAFSTNMMQLIVLRGIIGIGLGAQLPATYGSMAEYFPPKCRGRYSGFVGLIANFAPPLCTVLALVIIPHFGWRVLLGGVGAIGLIIWVVQVKFMPESPRWLASKGLIDKADEILTKVEKDIEARRGIKLSKIDQTELGVEDVPKTVNLGYLDLFKGQLLHRTIAITSGLVGMNVAIYTMVNWIPTIFVNNGLSVTKSLGMTTVMLIGAPFGVFLCSMFADKVPRKKTMVVLLFAVGIIGYIYSLQRSQALIMIIGFILMTVLYFYSVLVCAVYVGEVFPTEARLRGVGFANAIGRVASFITPPIIAVILTKYGVVSVFVAIFALLAVVAVFIAIFGVETRNKSLEEINEDLIR